MTDSNSIEPAPTRRRIDAASVALAALLVLTGVLRARLAAGEPLWLDETWTGVMASQTTLSGVWRQLSGDVGAPLFPLASFLWSRIGGLSDASLRAPALLFGLAAPLVALWPAGGTSPAARRMWSLLMALWIPGFWYAQDARCYTLLFLLGAAATAAFARLLAQPSLRRAFVWVVLADLVILTHYHALLLVAAQGLILLAVLRGRALRLWPAALAFAPAAAWLAYHLPLAAAYGRSDVAWQRRLRLKDLAAYAGFLAGSRPLAATLAAWTAVAAGAAWALRKRTAGGRAGPAWLAAAAAACGALAVVGMGFVAPVLTARYLTPFVPGLLLGLALLAERARGRVALIPAALAAAFVGWGACWLAHYIPPPERYYSFEAASGRMMQAGVSRLVFFWDHPAAPVVGRDQLAEVGGFFFRRAGRPVTVDPVLVPRGQDPQPELMRRAAAPGSAILWMYDRGAPGAAAWTHPPSLAELGASMRCRETGPGSVKILTCIAP
jgi:hypothetical protein